jgi:hypothetical protein
MTTQLQLAIHTAQQLSPVEQLELIKTMSQFLWLVLERTTLGYSTSVA